MPTPAPVPENGSAALSAPPSATPDLPPLCLDCLSDDVAVKIIDQCGFEHWFCGPDWAAQQAFHDKIMDLLRQAACG